MNADFVKPRYDVGGFAGIPDRITAAFASGQYEAVVLFLIDGFGWRFFERFQSAPFLRRLATQGRVEKLTSQFPSTTAAHLTTIHTGLPVGQSGVHEWYYYEPEADAIIAPLLFSFSGTKERDTLKAARIKPKTIYPRGLFYPDLRRKGITPYVFGSREYTPSVYSSFIMDSAELRGFKTLPEVLVNLGEVLDRQSNPAYIHLYFDKIDSLCHEYGPTSPQVEAECETFLLVMEHAFDPLLRRGKRILFLMTADHGMAEVDPQTTIYLNRHPDFAGFERFIRTNRSGQLLVPAGSARDMFLYIHDEHLEEAQAFLTPRLEGRADVVPVKTLMEQGFFGAELSARFRERVGNLVILPYARETVWWYEKDRFEMRFYGHHGGLTAQEMETVLYTLEV